MGRSLIVYADGGSRGNPGVAGYGAVVLDGRSGALLAERAEPLGIASNNVAEYSGVIAGLRAAAEIDPAAYIVARLDSKLVVEQLSGRWKIKHPDMRRLALVARDVAQEISAAGGSVTYEWVPREENTLADRLSNIAMDGETITVDHWRANAEADAVPERDNRNVLVHPDADAEPEPAAEAVPERDNRNVLVHPDADAEPEPAADAVPERDNRNVLVHPPEGSDPRESRDGPGGEDAEATPEVQEVTVAQAMGTGVGTRPGRGAVTRLVLVRHGVTAFTEAGRLDGRGGYDPPLSERGRAQAEQAARSVAGLLNGAPARLITSSLARAVQTGAVIAEALGVEPEVDADFDEQNFGDWDGAAISVLIETAPDDLLRFRHDPEYARPGGETHLQIQERVSAAYERVIAAGGTTVVVCHRKPIMCVMAHILGLTPEASWRLAAAPGSLHAIEVWQDGTTSIAFTNRT